MNLQKSPSIRMDKLRKSAKGQECFLRFAGICRGDTETTVLCHIPHHGSKGMGYKPHDLGVFGCSACHDFLDARAGVTSRDPRMQRFYEAFYEQMIWFIQHGYLK